MTPILVSLDIFQARYKTASSMFFTEQIKSIGESVVSVTTVYAAKMIGIECVVNSTEIVSSTTVVDDTAVADESNNPMFYSLENKCGTDDDAIAMALNAIV